jgi:hypothetical protein
MVHGAKTWFCLYSTARQVKASCLAAPNADQSGSKEISLVTHFNAAILAASKARAAPLFGDDKQRDWRPKAPGRADGA